MPIKLTSTEYKTIFIVALVSALSLGIGAKYFWRAFPEASIDFRVNRQQARTIAEQFLASRGYRIADYRQAARFSFDEEAKTFLEREAGLELARVIADELAVKVDTLTAPEVPAKGVPHA